MTAYGYGYTSPSSQAAQEVKEKRKQILEAVRKRRAVVYKRFRERVTNKQEQKTNHYDLDLWE
jgi:hypothetical protein